MAGEGIANVVLSGFMPFFGATTLPFLLLTSLFGSLSTRSPLSQVLTG